MLHKDKPKLKIILLTKRKEGLAGDLPLLLHRSHKKTKFGFLNVV
jgi:hypothetical protein